MTEPASTEGAGRILATAREEAERLGHAQIGTEHLLLALLRERESLPAEAAALLPKDPENAAKRLMSAGKRGAQPEEGLVLSSRARRIVDEAAAEAGRKGGSTITPEHLLTALQGETKGIAAAILREASGQKKATVRASPASRTPRSRSPNGPRGGSRSGSARSNGRWSAPQAAALRRSHPAASARSGARAGTGTSSGHPSRAGSRPAGGGTPAGSRVPIRSRRALPPRPPHRRPRRRPGASPRSSATRSGSSCGTSSFPPSRPASGWPGREPITSWSSPSPASPSCRSPSTSARRPSTWRSGPGPTVGGFLNATFGNAAELIISIFALRAGLIELVKASIIGSILGNLLLILGLSLMAAGMNKNLFSFNRTAAGMAGAMLALAVAALVFPALFHATHPETAQLAELHLSESVAIVLGVVYLLSLLFSLRTHRRLLGGEPHPTVHPVWGLPRAVGVLAISTVGIAVISEILVHEIGPMTEGGLLSQAFLGLIIIPMIGNAAEHASAVVVARKGKVDLALQIALGSSTQIALFVAPLLVGIGVVLGVNMNLVFTPFQVLSLALATFVSALITLDGESHWFEGVQLLALYALVGVAAYFI